jgi:DNA uptake protein ComE-like DNA-binding protein
MIVIIFIVPIYQTYVTHQPQDFTKENHDLDSIIASWKQQENSDSTLHKPLEYFLFNPNTASYEELVRLGFSKSLTQRIENYRNKGGKFLIKTDLLKIYGMDSTLYNNLQAYIDLPEKRENKIVVLKIDSSHIFKKSQLKIDINKADSVQLISIYGIGKKLSARIINYREKLGGFVSLDQLYEVYALDSATIKEALKRIYLEDNFVPHQLNLNTATEKELATHPYIKYTLAKAIAAYRFQHGNFKTIDELRNITLINDDIFKRIKPYLSIKI